MPSTQPADSLFPRLSRGVTNPLREPPALCRPWGVVVIIVVIGTYCGDFQSVPLSLLDRCGGCQDDRWDGVGWGLGKNEQWVDGGSGVCFSTLTPAPTGAALLLLSKYCGSACDLMVGEGETV